MSVRSVLARLGASGSSMCEHSGHSRKDCRPRHRCTTTMSRPPSAYRAARPAGQHCGPTVFSSSEHFFKSQARERDLMRLAPLLGVLQNDTAPMIIDHRPLFDLLDRSKAPETDIVIVQAAISYARGLSGVVDITHLRQALVEAPNLITAAKGNPGNPSQGQAYGSTFGWCRCPQRRC